MPNKEKNNWFEGAMESLKNAIRILFAGRKELSTEELLRKALYAKLLAVSLMLSCGGLMVVILLHLPQVLMLALILAFGLLAYITFLEIQEKQGHLYYVLARCGGKTKTMNVPGKPVFAYVFSPVQNPDMVFYLNRTEDLGFIDGMAYMFCFKGGENATMSNEDLVNYMPVSSEQTGGMAAQPSADKNMAEPKLEQPKGRIIKLPLLRKMKRSDSPAQGTTQPESKDVERPALAVWKKDGDKA